MKPHVFISSTFYDLRHVRDGIRTFIESLGYTPILSELSTFPVDPSQTAQENCRKQVEQEADILVLLIGNRYGSIAKSSSRSVTNVEYLAARVKGIPIYAFIDASLEPLQKLWRADATVDLSAQIDTPDLLRFVDEVQNTDGVWTFPFETPSDITTTLQEQFAYLMTQGLEWWRRAREGSTLSRLSTLGGESLRVALERPKAWEFLLFLQVVEDEVRAAIHLRDEHRENLALELGEDVVNPLDWARRRMDEIGRIVGSVTPLLSVCAKRAVGAPGVSGDVDDLIFVGQAIGRVYVAALMWSRRVRTANLPAVYEPIKGALAAFTNELVSEIEAYGPRNRSAIKAVMGANDGTRELDMTLTLRVAPETLENFNRVLAEIAAAAKERG